MGPTALTQGITTDKITNRKHTSGYSGQQEKHRAVGRTRSSSERDVNWKDLKATLKEHTFIHGSKPQLGMDTTHFPQREVLWFVRGPLYLTVKAEELRKLGTKWPNDHVEWLQPQGWAKVWRSVAALHWLFHSCSSELLPHRSATAHWHWDLRKILKIVAMGK